MFSPVLKRHGASRSGYFKQQKERNKYGEKIKNPIILGHIIRKEIGKLILHRAYRRQ